MNCVDVVVPCYRYGHFLKQCVESVLDQRGIDVRVLIIDDCSTDNSSEVALDLCARHERVSIRRHTVNKGHIATYNEGIEWVSSPYYLLLSADDYLLPGALFRSATFLDLHPEVGLAFGQQIALNEGDTLEYVNAENMPFDWTVTGGLAFIKASGARNCVPTPTAVVRTELQKRIGGYRPDLPHSGDMEMWLRLAAHADVAVSQACHAVYRRHTSNMSLTYTAQHWLPDVQQRKAAIDQLLQFDSISRDEATLLHRSALRRLALESISFASRAFNSDDIEASWLLRRFASDICPGIRLTKPWIKLECKRLVGQENWRSWKSSIAKIRQLSATEKALGSRSAGEPLS
jgi:glycosyltransferase involved in cell wall biosynthesis